MFHHNSPWPIASHRICFYGMLSILPFWTIFLGGFQTIYVFIECFFVCFRLPHCPLDPLLHCEGGLFTGSRDCCVMCGIPRLPVFMDETKNPHFGVVQPLLFMGWSYHNSVILEKTQQKSWVLLQIQMNICNGGWEVRSVAELALCRHWGGEAFIVWQQWREPCLSCSRHKALETQHETWCNHVVRCIHKCLFRRSWYCYCFCWENSIGKFHHSFTLAPKPARIQTARPQTTTKTHHGE